MDKLFGFYWKYLQRLSNNFDATIVSGEWLAERIDSFGVNNPVPVPFGIDKDFFSPSRRDLQLRAKLLAQFDLPESANLMIAISRHHPEKRMGTLIDGFRAAAEKKPMGLIVFGDGPIRKYVDYKANKSDYVKLMGFTENRDELANILASCDYFVHGSSAETYGIVVAEAVCSGLPVVVPARGGAADIANKDIAETYQSGNASALKGALLNIIQKDRNEMVKACQKTAEEGIGTMADHFELLFEKYQELVQQKKDQ